METEIAETLAGELLLLHKMMMLHPSVDEPASQPFLEILHLLGRVEDEC